MDNAAEVSDAFDRGTSRDMKVKVRPSNGEPFLIYLPRFVRKNGGDNAPITPHAWELDDIPEHDKFTDLLRPIETK